MKISEVSKIYDIPVDTLRYYEKEGLIPTVNRSQSGRRDYTQEDCNWVEFIKCMRSAGVQIDALAQYVKLFVQGDDTIEQRKNILIEQRKKLEEKIKEQRRTLALLKAKIENYESVVLDAEKNLK